MDAVASGSPLRPHGSSQGGVRQYNERVVLQALRQHGAMAGADLARLTRLTPQTVSLITKRLLDDGLLAKGDPVRGKVGQPSVPLALDADGAYSIGIKVGRRSMDLLLLDFAGQVRERASLRYVFPDPDTLLPEITQQVKAFRKALPAARRERLQGIGIAAPLSLGGWHQLLGVDPAIADKWNHVDLSERVARATRLPVHFVKDTAAACVAELVAGIGRNVRSFLYVFVDTFIGGGLVIDSHLRGGLHGNAGAVGSLALREAAAGEATPPQLLSVASLFNLEAFYREAGLDPAAAIDERALQPPWEQHTRRWLEQAAPAIAVAVHNAACLLDLDGIVIDGSFGRTLLAALLDRLDAALGAYSWEGVARPTLHAGAIGSDARALGGALLPLYANFAPDRDLFLKLER
ncbi:ROK family transcriptional regulator [Ramlibacter sp. AN1133]|uniref:ROK family transcriptional regulator n=1 Tax=Ramlibacter sp. AN1133 TaxID=3133429 RepID=UPI0030BE6217